MEKIKQAIEKARRENTVSKPPEQVDLNVEKEPILRERELDSNFNYSKTKVVDIQDEVFARNRIVLGTDNGEAATAYKILRTQVEQRLVAKGWNSLAITSPSANQGKTLTAVNLSIALARELHRTVLLVDLDLRNPSIHTRFELPFKLGLVDYLLDDVPVGEILINPGIERLVILPGGRPVSNSSELVSSTKMVKLVEELKARYPSRIIVFDLPPVLSTDDALAFSPYVDTTLLVVEDGGVSKDELLRTLELLEDVHLLGTVLNKASDAQPTYGGY